MKVDYSQGKIYKITNDYNDDIYVGSTCDRLVKRFSIHKKALNNDKMKHRKLYLLMNEIGFNRFRIELICDYPCDDKYQLRQKEGEYIRQMGTLNVNIAGRSEKEWRDENREILWEKKKEYRKNNDQYKAYVKEYTEKNKTKKAEYNKEYYTQNKIEYNEKRSQLIVTCECGCQVRKADIARHKKSQKHLELIKAQFQN